MHKDNVVDYNDAKIDFLLSVEEKFNNPSDRAAFDIYQLHSKKIIEGLIYQVKNNVNKNYITKKDPFGNDYLCIQTKHCSQVKFIVSFEEIFDLCLTFFRKTKYRQICTLAKTIKLELDKHYHYPPECLKMFLSVIMDFDSKKPESTQQPCKMYHTMGNVYIITKIQKTVEEPFRYLLIYIDLKTNFVLLRPLMVKTDKEISLELFKIFTQFGAPRTLQIHGYNSELTQKIKMYLKLLCPIFSIEVVHHMLTFDMPTLVVDKIQHWMDSTNSDWWELSCFLTQREMNDEFQLKPARYKVRGTPHDLFFNRVKDVVQTPVVKRFRFTRKKANNADKKLKINNIHDKSPVILSNTKAKKPLKDNKRYGKPTKSVAEIISDATKMTSEANTAFTLNTTSLTENIAVDSVVLRDNACGVKVNKTVIDAVISPTEVKVTSDMDTEATQEKVAVTEIDTDASRDYVTNINTEDVEVKPATKTTESIPEDKVIEFSIPSPDNGGDLDLSQLDYLSEETGSKDTEYGKNYKGIIDNTDSVESDNFESSQAPSEPMDTDDKCSIVNDER